MGMHLPHVRYASPGCIVAFRLAWGTALALSVPVVHVLYMYRASYRRVPDPVPETNVWGGDSGVPQSRSPHRILALGQVSGQAIADIQI